MVTNTSGNVDTLGGIGIDTSTGNFAGIGYGSTIASSVRHHSHFFYRGYPGLGFHFIQQVEYSTATGTTTWYGSGLYQSGMFVGVMA
jgi:hypothetical protein